MCDRGAMERSAVLPSECKYKLAPRAVLNQGSSPGQLAQEWLVFCLILGLSLFAVSAAAHSRAEVMSKPISDIYLSLSGGVITLPPTYTAAAYRPVQWHLHEGTCRRVRVDASQDDRAVVLLACYDTQQLTLAIAHENKGAAAPILHFFRRVDWQQPGGFTYPNVNSTGTIHFRRVNLTLKIKPLAGGYISG